MESMRPRGYTLVELMVVVAIIGIVASIAIVSFNTVMSDTHRVQAVSDLNVCAMALERYYSNDYTYVGALIDGSEDTLCPNRSPAGDGAAQYDLTLEAATGIGFVLQATPVGGAACAGKCIQLDAENTVTEL
jgi:prepilin-type N-terminal cleavage/methylation domain-containing protein|tara:strand:+ start:760 stop:1155 length:396 start_codon:yes stop_codon:yes gene_type:complete